MPTPTYTPLAEITLSSSAASVTFSSIPATYRDLVIVGANLNTTTSTTALRMRFNGDSASAYTYVNATGNGTTASSFAGTNTGAGVINTFGITTTANNLTIVNIMDYSATDKHKSFLSRANQAATATEMIALRWPSTAAITSVMVFGTSNPFAIGSTFTLYGIAA